MRGDSPPSACRAGKLRPSAASFFPRAHFVRSNSASAQARQTKAHKALKQRGEETAAPPAIGNGSTGCKIEPEKPAAAREGPVRALDAALAVQGPGAGCRRSQQIVRCSSDVQRRRPDSPFTSSAHLSASLPVPCRERLTGSEGQQDAHPVLVAVPESPTAIPPAEHATPLANAATSNEQLS